MRKIVLYHGISCWLTNSWATGEPVVQIKNPEDISKAFSMGFDCIGHPTEIVKSLTSEEFEVLSRYGKID